MLLVFPSVLTPACAEGLSLRSQKRTHPAAGTGRSAPRPASGPFLPWISSVYWHLLEGSDYPSENNRLCKVTLFRLGFFCVASEV